MIRKWWNLSEKIINYYKILFFQHFHYKIEANQWIKLIYSVLSFNLGAAGSKQYSLMNISREKVRPSVVAWAHGFRFIFLFCAFPFHGILLWCCQTASSAMCLASMRKKSSWSSHFSALRRKWLMITDSQWVWIFLFYVKALIHTFFFLLTIFHNLLFYLIPIFRFLLTNQKTIAS